MELFYDLHIHSCLSPCADDDMTPSNICGMASLAGLDIIALTDHNTCGNARVFCEIAENMGLVALPGMELTTREEVHVVCLFPDIDSAEAFSAYVYSRLPDISNRPDLFGNQIYMDAEDNPVGTEPKLLLSACDIGVYDTAGLAAGYGGIAFPAHIDRDSFSLLSNLGMWDDGMGFRFAEHTRRADMDKLPKIPYLVNSDAHRLEALPDAEFKLSVNERTTRCVVDALKNL